MDNSGAFPMESNHLKNSSVEVQVGKKSLAYECTVNDSTEAQFTSSVVNPVTSEGTTSGSPPPKADTSVGSKLTPSSGEIATSPCTPPVDAASAVPMSKRQQKRLAKREAFLAHLPQLRVAERQRRKEKRAALVAAGAAPKRPRITRMEDGGCDVRVVIDLSFDDLMTERDIGKCLKQVQRCYAMNRRAARPLQLHLSSMDGASLRLMDANDGWHNWDVHVHSDHFLHALEPTSVTYLSSESEHVLERLEPGRAYVIGGLVDHNHHKGVCHRRASSAGLRHARLPIDQFLEMKTRKVLTIDHVFAILLHVAGGRTWEDAFFAVLPRRKGAVLRCRSGESGAVGCDTVAAEAARSNGDGDGSGDGGGGAEAVSATRGAPVESAGDPVSYGEPETGRTGDNESAGSNDANTVSGGGTGSVRSGDGADDAPSAGGDGSVESERGEAGATGSERGEAGATGSERGKAGATGLECGVAGATGSECGEAGATGSERGEAGATGSERGEAGATGSERGEAGATGSERGEAGATRSERGEAGATRSEHGEAGATGSECGVDAGSVRADSDVARIEC